MAEPPAVSDTPPSRPPPPASSSPAPARVATSGRSPGTRSPASRRLGTRMKDRLEQLKAVSPAAPGNPAGGGLRRVALRGRGASLVSPDPAGGGRAGGLPCTSPSHVPRLPALSPPHRGHVPVIHRWTAVSRDASAGLSSLLHSPARQGQSGAGIRGGRLSPEELSVRSGAPRCAQDGPPPTLFVSLPGGAVPGCPHPGELRAETGPAPCHPALCNY